VLHEFVHVITDGRRFDRPVAMTEALTLARGYLGRSNVECTPHRRQLPSPRPSGIVRSLSPASAAPDSSAPVFEPAAVDVAGRDPSREGIERDGLAGTGGDLGPVGVARRSNVGRGSRWETITISRRLGMRR
jgi:hypothetical protein